MTSVFAALSHLLGSLALGEASRQAEPTGQAQGPPVHELMCELGTSGPSEAFRGDHSSSPQLVWSFLSENHSAWLRQEPRPLETLGSDKRLLFQEVRYPGSLMAAGGA